MTFTSSSLLVEGSSALPGFQVAREPNLEGGECIPGDLPDAAGQRLTVHFPNRREPDTLIVLLSDSAGQLLRYTETRGVPAPAGTMAEMEAQMARIVRTQIRLDYVTGEAMVVNSGAGQQPRGIRGAVTEFENSATLGDLRERADLVRRVCAP
ncbi:MAG: hypothetical protein EA350_15755 [Gemmatimonadales bacterium]|nr:MAG: hypothetical protein EA350_15755 [Gemmatimonadales bacterium]